MHDLDNDGPLARAWAALLEARAVPYHLMEGSDGSSRESYELLP